MNQANIESSVCDIFQPIPLEHVLLETDNTLQVPHQYTCQVYPSSHPHPLRGNLIWSMRLLVIPKQGGVL